MNNLRMTKETISLKDDVVVTKENVAILGEVIANRAVQLKKRFEGRNLEQLQRGMLYDIYHNKGINSIYSDGYDIVQESRCFLCNHIGKTLGEIIQKSKYGKGFDSLRLACYKHIYSYLRRQIVINKELECNEELDIVRVDEDCLKEPEDYTRVKAIIEKLKLTKNELKVLQGFFNGLTYDNTAEFTHLNRRTVARLKKKIKNKYIACFC
jgi:DNA-binding CsgD family transcriptional regulator